MDIEELKQKKEQLREDIRCLVENFEKETGVKVFRVVVEKEQIEDNVYSKLVYRDISIRLGL